MLWPRTRGACTRRRRGSFRWSWRGGRAWRAEAEERARAEDSGAVAAARMAQQAGALHQLLRLEALCTLSSTSWALSGNP